MQYIAPCIDLQLWYETGLLRVCCKSKKVRKKDAKTDDQIGVRSLGVDQWQIYLNIYPFHFHLIRLTPLSSPKKKRFKIISHYLASQHCTATFVTLVVTVVANIVNPARRCKLRQGSRLKNLIVMYTYWNFGLKVEYAEMFEKESSRSR